VIFVISSLRKTRSKARRPGFYGGSLRTISSKKDLRKTPSDTQTVLSALLPEKLASRVRETYYAFV
jgi:hypothetical protein